jgi:TetR/AcrR family tetracycline transcriptional repressor
VALRARHADLSEQEVVAAALRVVAREGAGRLTMRALAVELGLSSTASYYHVPSKTVLFELVADAVLADVEVPPPGGSWDERLRRMFISARVQLSRYPGVAQLLLNRTTHTANTRRLADELAVMLHDAGFDGAEAAFLSEAFVVYLFGRVTYETRALAPTWKPGPPLRPAASPGAAAGAAAGGFEIGLDLLIDGVRQRIALASPGG